METSSPLYKVKIKSATQECPLLTMLAIRYHMYSLQTVSDDCVYNWEIPQSVVFCYRSQNRLTQMSRVLMYYTETPHNHIKVMQQYGLRVRNLFKETINFKLFFESHFILLSVIFTIDIATWSFHFFFALQSLKAFSFKKSLEVSLK